MGCLNIAARMLRMKCFDCKNRLKLTLVKKDGVRSIECYFCWQLETIK